MGDLERRLTITPKSKEQNRKNQKEVFLSLLLAFLYFDLSKPLLKRYPFGMFYSDVYVICFFL